MALFTAQVEGELDEINQFSKSLAGAEVNVCIGLTRLGHEASYVTRLGNEPLGTYVQKSLHKEGIGTQFITLDDVYKTGIMFKNKVSEGKDPKTAYYRKGSAFSHMSAEDVDKIDFNGVKLVHVTGIPAALSESCREATFRLIDRAKEAGIYVTFDPNLRPALWESKEVMIEVINKLASKSDMVLPGISEGLTLMGSDEPEKIADFYQKLGAKDVVIKLGKDGAYVREGDKSFIVPGFKVENIVDTVGAGDGFAVGIISGILEGLSPKDYVIRANAIGAIQLKSSSDNEGLPTREELDTYIKKNK